MSDQSTILVIEDNPVTRKMLRVALESDRYAIIEAADARAALAIVEETTPDLVLQDLILPDMNGVDLVKRLRDVPGMRDVPILALSGFLGAFDDLRATESGFTAALVKPIEPEALSEAIAAYLPRPSAGVLVEGRRLLIVAEGTVRLSGLRSYFVGLGFDVITAGTTAEALGCAERSGPDVVLADVRMTGVDGFQLCFALRCEPRLADVPFVLISTDPPTHNDRLRADKVGARTIVQASSDLHSLRDAVLEVLDEDGPHGAAAFDEVDVLAFARSVIRQLARQTVVDATLARRCALQGAQLSLLGGIADALARRSDSDVAMREVLAATLDAAAISKGAMFLLGADGAPALRHAIGFSEVERAGLAVFFGQPEHLIRIIEGKLPVSLPSQAIPEEVSRSILVQIDVVSCEIVPLVSGTSGIGAIVLGARRSDVSSDDAVTFARAIGNQIVQSLALERSFDELAKSEQRYRTLMENASDAIVVFTREGIIRQANQRFGELLGVPREQLLGRDIAGFPLELGPGSLGAEFQPEHEVRGRSVTPVEIDRPDGQTFLVEFSITELSIGGETSTLAIGRDVTQQVRANAQLMISDRMASLGSMAASLAHEINNPLAAAIANIDSTVPLLAALAESCGNLRLLREVEQAIEDTREAANRVKVTVGDMKLFSRGDESGKQSVEVNALLDSSLRMARTEIHHRARLVRDYGPQARVLANESRLGQAFLNLIVNAAQSIPEGAVEDHEIRIRTRNEGASVVVEVADTGAGIPPSVLKKLFTPYFTTKPKGVGTGLGLAICDRIIAEYGGRITIDSRVGVGTIVRVHLPRTAVEPRFDPGGPSHPDAGVRGARILIVDDEVSMGKALHRQLSGTYEVTCRSDAREALAEIAAGARYDLILCDLMMPTMTGMELHARLEHESPEQARRMVFLTGGAFTHQARAFLEDRSRRRLEKPFAIHDLRAMIAEALHRTS